MKKRLSLLERMATVPHIAWVVLFIIGPMLFVLFFAFTDKNNRFSFSNIGQLTNYSHIFLISILFALIATVICLLIGYPLAYFMARSKPSTQKLLMILLMLPMWVSLLIRTYSLLVLLDNGGLINSLLMKMGRKEPIKIVGTGGAVVLGMIYDFLPYMVLPIYTSISKLDNRYLEAAADLGCTPMKTIFRVVLPLTMPGILSGVTMVFVPAISTFYISQKLGGGKLELIGDTIERQFKQATANAYHIGAALSLVMMILILISTLLLNKFSDDDEGGVLV